MPEVKGKHFPYTKEGRAAAKKAAAPKSRSSFKMRSGNSPAFKQMGNMPITPPPAMPVSPAMPAPIMQPPITQKSKYETPGTKESPGPKKGKQNPDLDKLSVQHNAVDEEIFNLKQDGKNVPSELTAKRKELKARILKLQGN